jgi:hypothetical protein
MAHGATHGREPARSSLATSGWPEVHLPAGAWLVLELAGLLGLLALALTLPVIVPRLAALFRTVPTVMTALAS